MQHQYASYQVQGAALSQLCKGGRCPTSLRKGGSTLPATATDPISQKYKLKKVCRLRFGNNLMIKYLQPEAGAVLSNNTATHVRGG